MILLLLSFLSCVSAMTGCAASHGGGTEDDGDAGRPPAEDAERVVPPLGAGDPTVCSTAPVLALDTTVAGIDPRGAVAPAPDPASCWSGEPTPRLYYRLEIPPRTGVEVRTLGENAPVIQFVDRCAPGDDRCHFFVSSGSFSPGERERVNYFGNAEDRPRTLILSPWWVGEPATFTLQTRSAPVAPHGLCDRPRELPAGILAPAAGERGGTYESWDCWFLAESIFYTLELPPRSRAVAMPGSQSLGARGTCTCDPGPIDPGELLVNLGDTPRRVLIEANPAEPIGATFIELPPNATCERAVPLAVGGPEAAFGTESFIRSASSDCGHVNDPFFYRVDVPAGAHVEVLLQVASPYPVLEVRASCDGACAEVARERLADGSLRAVLVNDSAGTVTRWITAGYTGPEMPGVTGTVRVRAGSP